MSTEHVTNLPFSLLDLPETEEKVQIKSAWQDIEYGLRYVRVGLRLYNVPEDYTKKLFDLVGKDPKGYARIPSKHPNSRCNTSPYGDDLELSVEGLGDGGYYMAVKDPMERGNPVLFQGYLGSPDRLEREKGVEDLVFTLETGYTNALPLSGPTCLEESAQDRIDTQLSYAKNYLRHLPQLITH